MKITRIVSCLILFLPCFFGCKKNNDHLPNPVVIADNFSVSAQGWTGDFADYPSTGDISSWELSVSHVKMPAPLVSTNKGIRLSGNNRSDDLFMFVKKKITGLAPNQTYNVRFEVELASNAASNSMGIGGAPGESVYLGAGFTVIEPLKAALNGKYQMNIDKMNQSDNGTDMQIIGNVSNGSDQNTYKLIKRTGNFKGKTDSKGIVWLIVGTDSGYEGLTSLYYSSIKASFDPIN